MVRNKVQLHKTVTVLTRYNDTAFTSLPEEGEIQGLRTTEVWLDNQVLADMGYPSVITVTVEPGDKLNPEQDARL